MKNFDKELARVNAEQRHDSAWAAYMGAVRKAIAGDKSYRVQQSLIHQSQRVGRAQLALKLAA